MILANFLTKISPKMKKNGSVRSIQLFFFLLVACSKFALKSIHQIVRFQFQKYKIFQLGGGGTPLDTPFLWVQVGICPCDKPHKNKIKKKKKKRKKVNKNLDLCPWLGGTCRPNFAVGEEFGEGFGRRRLALGNNSDFLEE